MGKWQIKSCRGLMAGALISLAPQAMAGTTTILAQGTINGLDQHVRFYPLSARVPTPTTYTVTFDKLVKDFNGQLNYKDFGTYSYFDAKGNLVSRYQDPTNDIPGFFNPLPNPGNKYTAFYISQPSSVTLSGHTPGGGRAVYNFGLIPWTSAFVASTIDGTTNYVLTAYQGVPEPYTWTLMILGFGLVGAGLRRKRLQESDNYGEQGRLI